jgi:NAD(P)-dependent dehydrogenase (short-subunit alcohol dehydrogenase family)
MNISLAGQRAIVTGASSGIGRGIAEAFAQAGAEVVVVGRDRERLETVVANITSTGGTAVGCQADVTTASDRERVVSEALERLGAITTLVNCAGLFELAPFEESLEALDRQWETNVRSSFALTQSALPHLRPGGRVLMMSSIAASIGFPTASGYCATKGAIEQITKALALEEAANQVRVNAIAPGNVRTAMNEHLFANEEYENLMLSMTPLGRIGEVNDIAPAAVFLCSDAASYITGVSLTVDGGWLAQ